MGDAAGEKTKKTMRIAAMDQGRCGEDADDEKVERFYKLLANIRALRGLCSAGESGSAAGRGRKRAREAEAPWRPAFRMEDFEEVGQVPADAQCAVKNRGAGVGVRLLLTVKIGINRSDPAV
ncbi:hypothetical protein PVAP13_3NG132803 [Panicum virgatum]|uniref:Uncharacterized protein n=1 Tax=Panicum virgatum TaxID=38727 RepID=A0A8T0UGU7_PANVG|nr:hypothetical protein PVAP13_3NG132803 [Panicum virgatum]